MRHAIVFLAISVAAIAAWWTWLGTPVPVPPSPMAANEKLYCVSYAPFRDNETPWMPRDVEAWQIDEDFERLKAITDCVRSYSIDHGLDKIPGIARKHGLKVIQGIWLSNRPDETRVQINTGIALAKEFPDVIRSIVVGNEVLLRGEMTAQQVANAIREVKAAVPTIPVTYADVWEYWLRNRDLASVADFVTVHLLPYWEDFPIPADQAVAHLNAIRKQVIAAFPGKEILIGETGWPSAGRMREGALPSPANQARFMAEVVALSKRENFHVNVIEAFDQPWKRQLEGTVGGYWGLFDARGDRREKFFWGEPVSNHPLWGRLATGGAVLAVVIFLAAGLASMDRLKVPWTDWAKIAVLAIVSGTLAGWAVADIPVQSLWIGDWLRLSAWALVAIAAPIACAAAIIRRTPIPDFAQILANTPSEPLARALGVILMVTTVLAVQIALGLVFDPRYRDFPFAALTAAVVPFLLLSFSNPAIRRPRPVAETAAAVVLGISALYIVFNESWLNWQSVWFCAGLVLLTALLARARAVPG